ncbi:hypothetical protein WEU38_10965 [Cyanobacterium aponinum AL20118]|uniref:Uncharacterized protein n=1 Tax=Cyanobacterium aponinum AL20115 TaxID=3090662 RepID=A0AAF0ZED3_9CHRO|nr:MULTISPECIES: hypothetical protein [Cyanobacterium]WPF87332.1 hypothetical protein SAY89_10995 [Cyanobacterium aponinum AL20115]WVL00479.1 hypothetical protein Dongsha4_17805 [Cyanobacterium sp. Dongsha4]
MQLVSSFEWYKLRSIIQLLGFIKIDDFIIDAPEGIADRGFNLYVNSSNLEFARDLLYKAEINKFLNNK